MNKLQEAQEALQKAQNYVDSLRVKLDQFKDLKKAYSEGAIIECNLEGKNGWLTKIPEWYNNYEYRIKDNISISSWQVHKDLIKQWWNGAEIEFYNVDEWDKIAPPAWDVEFDYRIKQDTWKLPEYEDGSEWVAGFDGMSTIDIYESYTKVGRRRATKELAERCAKASKTRDLLEAYRDHIEPDWENKENEIISYIYSKKDNYLLGSHKVYRTIGVVYGSKKTMQKICEALNSGHISL